MQKVTDFEEEKMTNIQKIIITKTIEITSVDPEKILLEYDEFSTGFRNCCSLLNDDSLNVFISKFHLDHLTPKL